MNYGRKTLSLAGLCMSDLAYVYIVVEGPTEQTFIRDILAPELSHNNIFLYAPIIGKPGHKGGNVKWGRAATDIKNLFNQYKQENIYVSTMLDFYGIDNNWTGKKQTKTN